MDYDIEMKELPARAVATIRVTTTPDKLAEVFGEILPRVMAHIQGQGVEPAGPAFGIFHVYDPDRVDMEAGFPVPHMIASEDGVEARELPGGRAAVTWHVGPYDSLGGAYRALEAWIGENGYEIAGPPWEVYWTGPAETDDSAQWRTEIGHPIR
jgi:effector-binding domain-containing protein